MLVLNSHRPIFSQVGIYWTASSGWLTFNYDRPLLRFRLIILDLPILTFFFNVRFWPSKFNRSILMVQSRPFNFGRTIWTVQFWSLKHHPSTHFEIFAAAIFLLQHSGTNYSTSSRPFLWQKPIQIQLERFGTKLAIFQNAMSCRHIS